MKTCLLKICALVFTLLQISIYAQEANYSVRVNAKNDFSQEYNDKWSIRWNEKTATPFSILGYKISKYKGAPEDIAKAFMREEKIMLGISDVDSNMVLEKNNYSGIGGTRLLYKQIYKEIPVLNSGYLIAVNNNSEIYYVSGDYYPEINVNTKPKLNKQEVIKKVEIDLNTVNFEIVGEPILSIYPRDIEDSLSYILVYKIISKQDNTLDELQYIIDANSGIIISKKSLIEKINGSGLVYQTNPLHGGTVSKTIHNLSNINPRKLDGNNVIVYNDVNSEASSSNAVFNYNTTDTHFDEVMAYYHSDEFETFLISKYLQSNRVGKVTIHTHDQDLYRYAASNSSQRIVYLSDGSNFTGLSDPAKEAAVICHEYMHIVSETYNTLTQNIEADAMDESYSDYFGLAYKNQFINSSIIGEYIDEAGGYVFSRNLINTYVYSQLNSIDLEPNGVVDEHDRSIIFSGGLWDYRRDTDVNASSADKVVLESLNNLDGSPSFLDGKDALVVAANALAYEQDINDIKENFHNHGIGFLTPTVSISGPASLTFKQTGNYTAIVTNGSGIRTYQWYKSSNGGSSWDPLGTAQTQTYTMTTYDIKLKVIIHDTQTGENAVSPIKNVLYDDGAPKMAATTDNIPKEYSLANYPNPFNPTTVINYQLPKDGFVSLKIYDALGREIKTLVNDFKNAGNYNITFDASNLPKRYLFLSFKC